MRGLIYDAAFKPLTEKWYRGVLEQIAEGSSVLDIGVGTAGSLLANADIIRQKNLRIVGVDINEAYIKRAKASVKKKRLTDYVDVRLQSIYDHQEGPYDVAYFAASFMLMPEPARAVRHVSQMLSEHGRIYFTQTFQEKKSPILEKTKPLLVKLTTIDFGRVTYEKEFLSVLDRGGVKVLSNEVLSQGQGHSFRRIVGQPNRD